MTDKPLNFGPGELADRLRYHVRYTTTQGHRHETSYVTLAGALADSHYPVNERKELFEVTTHSVTRKAITPPWIPRNLYAGDKGK